MIAGGQTLARDAGRDLLAPASPSGVSGVPQTCGAGVSGLGTAPGDGQLRHPQKQEVRDWLALNPRIRTISPLPRHRGCASSKSGSGSSNVKLSTVGLPQRPRAREQVSGLHQRVEPAGAVVCVDGNRRADPRES